MSDPKFYKQPTLVETKIAESPSYLPEKIGPYKIESLLSRGKMSLLYLGLHPQTRSLVVVKVLSPEYAAHPEMTAQFLHESKIASLTNHPNIVKQYGEGVWEGGLYIAMEFIRGVSLRQFIEQHSLSMKKSIDILMQVAHALVHLHSHGVIHGDLKPENILITEDGVAKVIDFGIAQLLEEVKKGGGKGLRIIGTPTYMSPEQKENPAAISFASDIYALGIIAYELFIGKLSFGIIHLSQVPKELRMILEKALAVSISERYSSVMQFVLDLSHYLKSGGFEKDRGNLDQVKESLEELQQAELSLSVASITATPYYEGTLSRIKVLGQNSPYFDSFKLPDGTFGFVVAEMDKSGFEAPIYLSTLRGMVRAVTSFSSKTILASLQAAIRTDPLKQTYALSLLILDPRQDRLQFVSCGMGSLLHLTSGSAKTRLLQNDNPPLGADGRTEWDMTVDGWDVGDVVVFHSFNTAYSTGLQEALDTVSAQSSQSQVDTLIKKTAPLLVEKKGYVIASIHRIG